MDPVPDNDLPAPPPRRWWRHCRRGLRWCGHGAWVATALILYAAVHLNQIGVPDFLKEQALKPLRERGIQLEFSRMRVRLTRGLVAENVAVTRLQDTSGEVIYAGELQLRLGWRDLLSLKAPALRSVTVRDGRVSLPLATEPDGPVFPFRVDNVQGRLRLDGAELWTLESFAGTCHGGSFSAHGSLANATHWMAGGKSPDSGRPAVSAALRRELLRYARALDRMTFSQPPALAVEFHVDAAHPEQSTVTATLGATGADSELGRFEALNLSLDLRTAPGSAERFVARLNVDSGGAQTRWGSLRSLRMAATAEQELTNSLPAKLELELGAEQVATRWSQLGRIDLRIASQPEAGSAPVRWASAASGSARGVFTEWARLTNADFRIDAHHRLGGAPTNWLPDSARIGLSADQVVTKWARVGQLALEAEGQPADGVARGLDVWWGRLEPYVLAGTLRLTNFSMPKLALDSMGLSLGWSNGAVAVTGLAGRLYGGGVTGEARLDVGSRFASAKVTSDFDLHRLEPLLTTNAVRWIRQYGWQPEQPVVLAAEGSAVLPAWTNRQPDWRGEVLPTLLIAGTATVTNFTFRGLPGDRGFVPFAHTNVLWTIRNARAWRPEGEVEFDYEGDTETQDYHFRVRSSVDPNLVRPLLEPGGIRALDLFQFSGPPHLEGDIWGRWFARERTGIDVRLGLTNVTFRGEQVDEFRAAVTYTNQFVDIRNVDIRRGPTWAQVPSAGFDVGTRRLYLTNAMATLDVAPVTRVIGPKTHAMMSAYQFDQPLRAVVNGVIPIGNTDEADVTFEASLGGFHWWRFNTTNTSALLRWQGDRITVSKLDTGFHGGRLNGDIWVDTTDKEDVQFGFDATGRDLDVPSLLRDLLPNTNRLEGVLSTHLVVDRASAREDGGWTGRGEARLKDGYLWGLPLFGVLSGPLEAISPGLGQQSFKEGAATFTITNRVVISRDLELKSPAMRMRFNGEVGFDAHLDSRMEVEPLRDIPVVGGLVSTVLRPFTKLLEFDVKGRLGRPEADFRHVPAFILAPLRPIQTLKALFPEEATEPAPKADTPTPSLTPAP